MSDQVLERQGAAVIPRDLAPAPVKTARLSRRKLLLAAAALVIATGGSWYGYDWWTIGRFIESTDDAYVGGDITVIAPKVAGFITKLAITDNQTVKAGQLLLQIDDRDYRAALAKADAAVAMQQASLANLAATRRLQESTIAQAQADLITTDAETIRTQEDDRPLPTLAKDQCASLQRYQQANATYKEAVARRRQGRMPD